MRLTAFTRIPRRWPLPTGAVLIALALLLTCLALLLGARAAEGAVPRDFYAASVNGSDSDSVVQRVPETRDPGSSPHPSAFTGERDASGRHGSDHLQPRHRDRRLRHVRDGGPVRDQPGPGR